MKMDLLFVEVFPHPIEKVWRALTEPAALASWLMENDFAPVAGRRFTLRGPARPGWRGWNECEVVALEPPTRMVWSWQVHERDQPSRVEFLLEEISGGTRLTLRHIGETDPETRERTISRWPQKLNEMRAHLSAAV